MSYAFNNPPKIAPTELEPGHGLMPKRQEPAQLDLQAEIARLTAERDDWALKAMEWRRKYAELRYPGMTNEVHALGVRAAVLAERERNEWKRAMDQELVSLHLGTTDTPGYDTPKGALDEIIKWHTTIALDPAVSSDAAALIAAERERCAKVCEAEAESLGSGGKRDAAALCCASAIRAGTKSPG